MQSLLFRIPGQDVIYIKSKCKTNGVFRIALQLSETFFFFGRLPQSLISMIYMISFFYSLTLGDHLLRSHDQISRERLTPSAQQQLRQTTHMSRMSRGLNCWTPTCLALHCHIKAEGYLYMYIHV